MSTAKKDEMLYIKAEKDFKALIDQYRKDQDVIPSRSEAIRDLIRTGLKAKGYPVE